jgi:hypothetical protein
MTGLNNERGVLLGRCAVGAAQGLALFFLTQDDTKFGGNAVLGAAVFAALFWPAVLLVSIGAMKRVHFLLWGVVSGVAIAALGAYAAGRLSTEQSDAWLGFAALTAVLVFIAHHLVQAGLKAGTWRAPYADYFDLAWTHAVRLGLAFAFVGAFWALLWLGAGLFGMIGVTAFLEIITEPSFSWPASTIAVAVAVHLTDERANLVIGARTLALTLLSWLLPVAAAITLLFLVLLPIAGFEQLWASKISGGLMLTTASALVLLLNAVYQAGETEPKADLAWSSRIASVLLVPLLAIAAYGLVMRTGQHGLTEPRVIAWAGLALLCIYAAGYVIAAFARGPFMARLPYVNVIAAYAAVAVLAALLTPVADPARLATADQIARLMNGKTAPATFDYAWLLRSPTHTAQQAALRLEAMEGEGREGEIGRLARAARDEIPPFIEYELEVSTAEVRAAVPVAGAPLPEEVLVALEFCARGEKCAAFRRNLDADPALEIVVAIGSRLIVFDRDDEQSPYRETAGGCCFSATPSLAMPLETVAPQYSDLKVGTEVLTIQGER